MIEPSDSDIHASPESVQQYMIDMEAYIYSLEGAVLHYLKDYYHMSDLHFLVNFTDCLREEFLSANLTEEHRKAIENA